MATPEKKATAKKSEVKAASQSPKVDSLRVTAPLVQVRVKDKIVYLFEGDVLPEGVSQESIDHLRDLDFIK